MYMHAPHCSALQYMHITSSFVILVLIHTATQHTEMNYNVLHRTALHCTALHLTAPRCSIYAHYIFFCHSRADLFTQLHNTLHETAPHCNALHRIAAYTHCVFVFSW